MNSILQNLTQACAEINRKIEFQKAGEAIFGEYDETVRKNEMKTINECFALLVELMQKNGLEVLVEIENFDGRNG